MRLAVLKERRPHETRVSATPETVKRLVGLGLDVVIESGAGVTAAIADSDFVAAGGRIGDSAEATLAGAEIVFAVQMPLAEQRAAIQRGALLVCVAGAFGDPDLVPSLAAAGIDAAAMELLPRITRAQSMDVLSSQANLAGYRAVIEAALGTRPQHLAYPVGDRSAAGPREFKIAADLGFKTAVTTRPGVIFREHASHLLALPRVSLNGEFQRSRYASVLVSGAATGLWNGFRKLNVA